MSVTWFEVVERSLSCSIGNAEVKLRRSNQPHRKLSHVVDVTDMSHIHRGHGQCLLCNMHAVHI